jgi:hypothetical protein
MKHFLIMLGLVIGLFACQSENTSDQSTTETEKTVQPTLPVDIASMDESTVRLMCKEVTQAGDQETHHQVSAVINENIVEVGDLRNCSEVDTTTIASWEQEGEIFQALGGPAGDIEEYIFIARVGDLQPRIVVKKATRSLTKVDGELTFRNLAVFDENDLSSEPGINKVELVGSFAYSGQTTSYVLFVGLKNKDLSGQLFQIEGPLPEKDAIMGSLGTTPPKSLGYLRVDLAQRIFKSDLGTGSFAAGSPPPSITLDDVKDENGESLTLERL